MMVQSGGDSNDQVLASGSHVHLRVTPQRSNCSPQPKLPFRLTKLPLRRERSPLTVHPRSVEWTSNPQRSLLRQPAASSRGTIKVNRLMGKLMALLWKL